MLTDQYHCLNGEKGAERTTYAGPVGAMMMMLLLLVVTAAAAGAVATEDAGGITVVSTELIELDDIEMLDALTEDSNDSKKTKAAGN